MELTQAFFDAVDEKNIRKIRIMLKDSLLVDPTFERFNKMEKIASSVQGLYDEHDGRSFNSDPEEWDDDYMDKIMVQVVGNFSHERMDHLKEVVKKLRPVSSHSEKGLVKNRKVIYENNQGVRKPYQDQKKEDQENGTFKYLVGTGIGAAGGGIIGGCVVGGIILSLPAAGVTGCTIGGALVGATAGAGVVYENGKRRR